MGAEVTLQLGAIPPLEVTHRPGATHLPAATHRLGATHQLEAIPRLGATHPLGDIRHPVDIRGDTHRGIDQSVKAGI